LFFFLLKKKEFAVVFLLVHLLLKEEQFILFLVKNSNSKTETKTESVFPPSLLSNRSAVFCRGSLFSRVLLNNSNSNKNKSS